MHYDNERERDNADKGEFLVSLDFIKAVAHIGIDFGFGEYKLDQRFIDEAREIYEKNGDL
tara:strand:+ start:64 stop:243 length:180 start_codon:yes stop_codon:yes gene_type:complete